MGTVPSPPLSANSLTVTAQSVLTAAMQEIGVLSPGEMPSNGDSAWVLQKLQRLLDRYNSRSAMIYSVDFAEFTLPVNVQPVTIGPGDETDFNVNQRPVKINSAMLILNGGVDSPSQVEVPMFIRDKDWWATQTIKSLTSTLPTDLYYSPDWPVGNIYFWPIPVAVNNVRLEMWSVLGQMTNYNQFFTMPPGYWDLVIFELAVDISPSFERPVSPDLRLNFMKAQKAVEGNNIYSPRLKSDAPSQVSVNRARPDFNFLNGLSR